MKNGGGMSFLLVTNSFAIYRNNSFASYNVGLVQLGRAQHNLLLQHGYYS